MRYIQIAGPIAGLAMASGGCVQNSSAQIDKDFTNKWDLIISGNIVYDKKRLSWWNSYELLKKLVDSAFVQRGKWWTPGGKARRFDSSIS